MRRLTGSLRLSVQGHKVPGCIDSRKLPRFWGRGCNPPPAGHIRGSHTGTSPAASQPPASFDRKKGQSHLQFLHSFDNRFPRRWVLVRLFSELGQNSVCLGDVLDSFCLFPLLLWCGLVRRHVCLLCPAVSSLVECRFYLVGSIEQPPGRICNATVFRIAVAA